MSVSRDMRSSRSQKAFDIGVVERRVDTSSTQIGAGLVRNRPKISATAVSACSPPDRSERLEAFAEWFAP